MIAAMVFSLTACGGAQPGNGSTAAGGKDDIYNNEYAGEFIWTRENNVSGWADLMAGQEKELTEEEMIYFSPAVATPEQLKGLPEAIILVGSLDLFCDEDMDLCQKAYGRREGLIIRRFREFSFAPSHIATYKCPYTDSGLPAFRPYSQSSHTGFPFCLFPARPSR